MKLSFHLLSIVAIAPLVSAKYETVFTFKDDFFLKFCGLSDGMGPSDGEVLIDGLNAQVGAFQQAWKEKIELLQDGACKVIGDVPAPKFSYCDWKYPDRYDIERLPLASQCHEHGGEIANGGECYVQRLFYRMKDLKVRCPNKLPMKDLNRSDLLEDALEAMVPALNINTVNPAGPWEEAFGVTEVKSNDECNAFLSINRFTEIDIDLKCLKEEFTIDKADLLKEALDEYFETNAVPKIIDTVENETPMSAVYSVKSPYDKDGDTMYCYYPSYYSDGTLVDQYEAADGNIITKFKCGFDLVWFKDKGFNDSLLPDLVATVQKVFTDDDPSFLAFIQDKYSDVAWVQNTEECGVVDTNNTTAPTLRPTTVSPTGAPSKLPTNVPTSSPIDLPTDTPSLSTSESPSNIPSTSAAPTPPTDTSTPTQSPTTAPPTDTPSLSTSESPSNIPSTSPSTRSPTNAPSASPMVVTIVTSSPVLDDCVTQTNVTEEESPFVKDGSGTCGGGNIGDGICAAAGECCSQWGWCGTTEAHCDNTAPASTPIDPNLGKCGAGDGIIGDGTCLGENECCSQWGYCGTGDQYCSVTIDTKTNESSEGKCGGGGVGLGECFNEGDCCSEFGFCGSTDDYCTGVQPRDESGDTDTSGSDNPLIPDDLKPTMGYRCGKTETDARSNCKKECTHARGDNNGLGPCEDDEECWGVQLNYCNTFDEGTHPICTDLDLANSVSRCGLDEVSARGHCGNTCDSDDECPENELCFDVMENLCDCHLDNLDNSGSSSDMPLPDAEDDVDEVFDEKEPEPIYNQEAPESIVDVPTYSPTYVPLPSDDVGSSGDSDDELSSLSSNPFLLAKAKIQPYFVKSLGEGSVEGLARDNASPQVNLSVAVVSIIVLNALFNYLM